MALNWSGSREKEEQKGFENGSGQNNCFLNVVLQGLWHLEAFRVAFLQQKNHYHLSKDCIFCAIETIFTHYKYSEVETLPPTALREALSELFRGESRFQIGQLDDAAEALDSILLTLHRSQDVESSQEHFGSCKEPPCFVHKIFGLTVLEQEVCSSCKENSEPLTSNMFIYYVYAVELRAARDVYRDVSMDKLLKIICEKETRPCSNVKSCQASTRTNRFLLNEPQIFTLGLVWDTADPSAENIRDTLDLIQETMFLCNVFESGTQTHYELRGMICYYGKHYDAYFFSNKTKVWWVFDDAMVKEVGKSWEEVKSRCCRGRFQPAIIFYQRTEGAPIETTESPYSSIPYYEQLIKWSDLIISPIKSEVSRVLSYEHPIQPIPAFKSAPSIKPTPSTPANTPSKSIRNPRAPPVDHVLQGSSLKSPPKVTSFYGALTRPDERLLSSNNNYPYSNHNAHRNQQENLNRLSKPSTSVPFGPRSPTIERHNYSRPIAPKTQQQQDGGFLSSSEWKQVRQQTNPPWRP